jgi:hypothetical protein
MSVEEQFSKVWMTEAVLCSAKKEGGHVPAAVVRKCASKYLAAQLGLLRNALVVPMGGKARYALDCLGFTDYLHDIYAAAPPGCNTKKARESWDRIPIELARRRGGAP